jgi:hypothetical protein
MDELLISDGQRFALNKLIGTQAGTDCALRLWMLCQLIGRDIASSSQVVEREWRIIRDEAYPEWRSNDWSVSDAFTLKLCRFTREYREKVLGQMRLF